MHLKNQLQFYLLLAKNVHITLKCEKADTTYEAINSLI